MEELLAAEPVTTSDGRGGRIETIGAVRSIYASLDSFSNATSMRVRQEERLLVGSLVMVTYDDSEERL